jgi:CheY-like chemotaxis protein
MHTPEWFYTGSENRAFHSACALRFLRNTDAPVVVILFFCVCALGPTMAQTAPPRAKHILAVDDDDMSFFILKTILSHEPVELTRAVDGVDAVQQFKDNHTKFELILMDIEMPRMNGLEAAQKIRAFEIQEDLAPTMIVALTAHDEPEYHRKIFDARMNSIVQKPVRQQPLLEAMRIALESALIGKGGGAGRRWTNYRGEGSNKHAFFCR